MHSTEAERKAEERQKNRVRRDWFYREVLPKRAATPLAKCRLWARGNSIQRQWRAYWAAHDAAVPGPNVIPFPPHQRSTP